MIRIVKVTAVTYPNPNYPADARKDSMDIVFAPGQPMATTEWADIAEGKPASPRLIQIDADGNYGYQVKNGATEGHSIRSLSIWTEEDGRIYAEGDAYIQGRFLKRARGPVAYIIGFGGTLFLSARKVIDTDITP